MSADNIIYEFIVDIIHWLMFLLKHVENRFIGHFYWCIVTTLFIVRQRFWTHPSTDNLCSQCTPVTISFCLWYRRCLWIPKHKFFAYFGMRATCMILSHVCTAFLCPSNRNTTSLLYGRNRYGCVTYPSQFCTKSVELGY